MRQYEIVYTGQCLSLNNVKSQHWRKTEKQKNEIKARFEVLVLLAKMSFMKRFYITMTYNSRHDPDGVVFQKKILVDVIRRKGYVIDDSRKYYRGFSVAPDETLPPNTFKFLISEVH
jgi:hypothetical protein